MYISGTTPILIIFDVCILKTFFIIRLLINATMANPIENDAVDRVKRGSLNFKLLRNSISAAKKNFIVAQIKKLNKDVSDASSNGKLAVKLRHSYFTFFWQPQSTIQSALGTQHTIQSRVLMCVTNKKINMVISLFCKEIFLVDQIHTF